MVLFIEFLLKFEFVANLSKKILIGVFFLLNLHRIFSKDYLTLLREENEAGKNLHTQGKTGKSIN